MGRWRLFILLLVVTATAGSITALLLDAPNHGGALLTPPPSADGGPLTLPDTFGSAPPPAPIEATTPTTVGKSTLTVPTGSRSAPTAPTAPASSGPSQVTFRVTGSCRASHGSFICTVGVTASNGLVAAGFVQVDPAADGNRSCADAGALSHGSVTITGSCNVQLAPDVLAVYALTTDSSPASGIATGHLPWT